MTGSVRGSEPSRRGALPEKGDRGRRSLRGGSGRSGMEWPVAFGDGLRMFPHHVLESPFLPDAPFPDASHGIFGKTQSLWDEATVGKLKQGLRWENLPYPHRHR